MSTSPSTLSVVLLWHMHQPYYVDPQTKVALMPWVRLHSIKGYYDMIRMSERYPEVRLNFNFTPVLVRQIREIAEAKVTDQWETWSRTPAEELGPDLQYALLENFFKINHENCVRPYPRYAELLELRGPETHARALRESVSMLTVDDYRDLQVWYNLAWCGFSICREYPELEELKRKGRGFSEEEKNRLLDIHREVVGRVLDRYRKASDEHRIELTTTPYFHPIMPLVYDTEFGKRAMPGREFPERFQAPDDVRAHLMKAQKEHEAAFGCRARGLWPSEGSVAPELIPLFAEAGIEYFCTDEDILFRSLPAGTNHLELFKPWKVQHEGAGVAALFRERPLSDFIGFNAARNSPRDASDYLLHHLEHLAEVIDHENRVVCLALDGENAWEAFPDGGEEFLDSFYRRMLESKCLHPRRIGDIFDENKSLPTLDHLHTGSWIGANFDIWIGDPEENKGWEWIARTRADLVNHLASHEVAPEEKEKAWDEIYAAEGSDWFWWYGPDFHNDSDMLFDGLFRKHLQNVYHILGIEVPTHLDEPIRKAGRHESLIAPSRWIEPPRGQESVGFYDWLGAGHFDIMQQSTAMFQSDRVGKDLYFGFSRENFFFRFDLQSKALDAIVMQWIQPEEFEIRAVPANEGWSILPGTSGRGKKTESELKQIESWGRSSLMLAVPLSVIGVTVTGGKRCAFNIKVIREGVETERYPEHGQLEFEGPGDEFHRRNWFI
jgi:alpha-amylase/alpha-mannosidase (GH57 family)